MEKSTTPDVVKALLQKDERDYTRWVPVYTTVVTIVGFLLIFHALHHLPENMNDFLIFLGFAALTEILSLQLFRRSHSIISFSAMIAIASVPIFGPMPSIIVYSISGITTAATGLILYKENNKDILSWFQRWTFNTGMFVVSIFIAGHVYTFFGGEISSIYPLNNIIPFLCAGLIQFMVNHALLLGVIFLQTGQDTKQIWNRDFKWNAPTYLITVTIGSGLIALIFNFNILLSGISIVLITFVAFYSSRQYVSNMKVHVENLEKANERLEGFNLTLFMTLSSLIDAYDAYTFGHSAQVTVYAEAIAEKLGLKREEIDVIVRGALVHDIGKVGVMDSIIGKQGPLTDEEYALVKKHPDIGAEILSRAGADAFEEIIPLVRFHHERWDGSGYPLGLSGERIPLGARIIGVADSVDAMLSDRPYRRPPTFEDVMEEILRCMGRLYDPRVAQAFFEVAREKGPTFFKNSAEVVDKKYRPDHLSFLAPDARYLKKSMIWHVEAHDFTGRDEDE